MMRQYKPIAQHQKIKKLRVRLPREDIKKSPRFSLKESEIGLIKPGQAGQSSGVAECFTLVFQRGSGRKAESIVWHGDYSHLLGHSTNPLKAQYMDGRARRFEEYAKEWQAKPNLRKPLMSDFSRILRSGNPVAAETVKRIPPETVVRMCIDYLKKGGNGKVTVRAIPGNLVALRASVLNDLQPEFAFGEIQRILDGQSKAGFIRRPQIRGISKSDNLVGAGGVYVANGRARMMRVTTRDELSA